MVTQLAAEEPTVCEPNEESITQLPDRYEVMTVLLPPVTPTKL